MLYILRYGENATVGRIGVQKYFCQIKAVMYRGGTILPSYLLILQYIVALPLYRTDMMFAQEQQRRVKSILSVVTSPSHVFHSGLCCLAHILFTLVVVFNVGLISFLRSFIFLSFQCFSLLSSQN